MKGRAAPNQFDSRDEHVKMRISRELPPRTLIWIARIDGMHLGNFGTDFALRERYMGRPGDSPTRGAQPFSAQDLSRMQKHANLDLLAFLLLRWTGLRGSDAVNLRWSEIHFDRREIERVTQKRKKKVILPIHSDLFAAIEMEYTRRQPQWTERVLLHPVTQTPLTRKRLYYRMLSLGNRAGVAEAHPHRFRDTFAVDMLARGASPYDVAKLLGDTIETVEKHYAEFVRELRERVRRMMESNEGGLEAFSKPTMTVNRSGVQ